MNEYLTAGDTSFVYDLNGNRISRTDPNGTTTYAFNDQNRLTHVSGPGTEASYLYNALGLRIGKTENGQTSDYLVDPTALWSQVAEFDAAGQRTASYVFSTFSSRVSRIGGGGDVSYYDFDAVGNTTGLTDSSGVYVNRYQYLPFGETTVIQSSVENAFTFGGRTGVSRSAGLMNMRAREYDVEVGAFLSVDPIGLHGNDVNLRRYVGNDPVSHIDPTGLAPTIALPANIQQLKQHMKELGIDEDVRPIPDVPENKRFVHIEDGKIYQDGNQTALCIDLQHVQGTDFFAQNAAIKLRKADYTGVLKKLYVPEMFGFLNGQFAGFGKEVADLINGSGSAFNSADLLSNLIGSLGPLFRRLIGDALAQGPNDIVGPGGFDEALRFIQPGDTLPYLIRFENIATATAPAQEVFVTHQLDADLDWSTFELDDFGFGPLTIDVPVGQQAYATRVDFVSPMSGNAPLLVDVAAALNPLTGIVTWVFRSVDPLTGEFPEDPFAGFLPPNDPTQRGEGFLNYLIRPKADLATGALIEQQASIIFDFNSPIATNIWTNTIDAGSPTSSVTALPSSTTDTSFTVSWSGVDDTSGSGIAFYDIFVSDNGGPFTLWFDDTTETSATYTGQFDHTYAFYSVSSDNVGQTEGDPATPDATTFVNQVPELDVGGPAVTWINKQPPVMVLPQITVGNTNLAGGTLRITVNAIAKKQKLFDQFSIPSAASIGSSSGPAVANGQLTLQVQLSQSVTGSAVQSFLRAITFSTKGKGLKALTRMLSVTLSNSSATSTIVSQTINVRKKA